MDKEFRFDAGNGVLLQRRCSTGVDVISVGLQVGPANKHTIPSSSFRYTVFTRYDMNFYTMCTRIIQTTLESHFLFPYDVEIIGHRG